jgi:hypothetical protein
MAKLYVDISVVGRDIAENAFLRGSHYPYAAIKVQTNVGVQAS